MKILLSGATGLIGKALGVELVNQGHQIHALVRDPKRAQLPFSCKSFTWSNHEAMIPPASLEGVEAVIHLAGDPVAEGRWNATKKKLIYDSRIIGTSRLGEAIQAYKASQVKCFIAASAIGFYGDCGEEWLNENTKPGNDFLSRVVVDWEKSIFFVQKQNPKIRVIALRTGLVLSQAGGMLGKVLPIFSKGLGGHLGDGQQYMSWIHIKDIVNLYIFCLNNEKVSGVMNAVAPQPITNQEFTKTLAHILHRPAFMHVPKFALHLATGEMSEALLASQRVSSEKAQKLGFQFKFPDLQSALEAIN